MMPPEDQPSRRYGPVGYPVRRVVGGSSATNGALALRPWREDMARWAEVAGPACSWEAVLPLLRTLESDADVDGPLHGRGGPLPIERPDAARCHRFMTPSSAPAASPGWRRSRT